MSDSIRVKGPGGVVVNFPAGTSMEVMEKAMREKFGGPEPQKQQHSKNDVMTDPFGNTFTSEELRSNPVDPFDSDPQNPVPRVKNFVDQVGSELKKTETYTQFPEQALGGAIDGVNAMGDIADPAFRMFDKESEGLPHIPTTKEPETIAGGLVRGVSQFGVGRGVAGKVVGKTGKAAGFSKPTSSMGKFASEMGKSAIADGIAFDGTEGHLSDVLIQMDNPILNNAVTQYLATADEDSEADGRFKNILEGAGIGGLTGTVLGALKLARQRPDESRFILDAAGVGSDMVATSKSIRRLLINSGVPRDVVHARLSPTLQTFFNDPSALDINRSGPRMSLARFIEGEFAEEFPEVSKNIRGFLLHRSMDSKHGGQAIVSGAVDDLRGTQGDYIRNRITEQLGSQASNEAEAIVKDNLRVIGRDQIEASLKRADNSSPDAHKLAQRLHNDMSAKSILGRRAYNAGMSVDDYIDQRPVEAAHWVQSDLSAAAKSATGFEKVELGSSVKFYQDVLDEVAPGYREARANYAHEVGVRDALGYTNDAGKYQKGIGDEFIRNAKSERATQNMADQYAEFTPAQAAAANLGIRDNLTDVMRTGRADGMEIGPKGEMKDVAGARLARIQTEGVTDALPRVLGESGQEISDELRRAISERQFNIDIDHRTGSNSMNKAEAMATGASKVSGGLGRMTETTGGMTPSMAADAALIATGNLPIATLARSGLPGVSKVFQPSAKKQNALAELLLTRPQSMPPEPPINVIGETNLLLPEEQAIAPIHPHGENNALNVWNDKSGAATPQNALFAAGAGSGAVLAPDTNGDGHISMAERAAFAAAGAGAVKAGQRVAKRFNSPPGVSGPTWDRRMSHNGDDYQTSMEVMGTPVVGDVFGSDKDNILGTILNSQKEPRTIAGMDTRDLVERATPAALNNQLYEGAELTIRRNGEVGFQGMEPEQIKGAMNKILPQVFDDVERQGRAWLKITEGNPEVATEAIKYIRKEGPPSGYVALIRHQKTKNNLRSAQAGDVRGDIDLIRVDTFVEGLKHRRFVSVDDTYELVGAGGRQMDLHALYNGGNPPSVRYLTDLLSNRSSANPSPTFLGQVD